MRIAHFSFDHPHRCYHFEGISLGPRHPFREEGGGCGFRGSAQFEWPRLHCQIMYVAAKNHRIHHELPEKQHDHRMWSSTQAHWAPHTSAHCKSVTAETRWLHTRTMDLPCRA